MYEWCTKILDLETVQKVIDEKFKYNNGDAVKARSWKTLWELEHSKIFQKDEATWEPGSSYLNLVNIKWIIWWKAILQSEWHLRSNWVTVIGRESGKDVIKIWYSANISRHSDKLMYNCNILQALFAGIQSSWNTILGLRHLNAMLHYLTFRNKHLLCKQKIYNM